MRSAADLRPLLDALALALSASDTTLRWSNNHGFCDDEGSVLFKWEEWIMCKTTVIQAIERDECPI